jgi:hypothetical protein
MVKQQNRTQAGRRASIVGASGTQQQGSDEDRRSLFQANAQANRQHC